jgi:hypothetical protein
MSESGDSDGEGGGEIEPFNQEHEAYKRPEEPLAMSLSGTMPPITVLSSGYPPFIQRLSYMLIPEQQCRRT